MAQENPIDELFTLSPDDFISARDALAKRLKAQGDAEAARQVRQLRRPSVAAWAVNQLVRAAPEDLQRLLDTGATLRRAQRAALSGAGGGRLRAATAQRRALLDEVTGRAARLLAEAGRNPDPHRGAIAGTLEAATVDDQAAELVRSGRLSRELPPPSGFGDLTGLTLVPDLDDADDDDHTDDHHTAEPAADAERATDGKATATATAKAKAKAKAAGSEPAAGPEAADAAQADTGAQERAAAADEERQAAAERQRVARAAADEEAAARARADEAEAAAAQAEEEATGARERADAATETVRDLERRLAEARRAREETERAAVDAESSAYRAHRAAAEAVKTAERARAASAGAADQ